VRLPLAQAEKLPWGEWSLEAMGKKWPAFRHEPFETAGFNAVTLPFRYESTVPDGNHDEAFAFSFLISFGLDWGPGCYCTRHAYFIFKRSRRYMDPLARHYDPRGIAYAIEDWNATHAVGGLLRKVPGGYEGTLEIYDASGEVVCEKTYEGARDYFTLVGDMAVDALTFFGPPPSAALAEHLHKPRCHDFQSILDLGSAAFVDEKSPLEFGIYKRILQRDPGFGEVRYWWANQKQWCDGNRKAYFAETARSMDDYLTSSALTDFEVETCPDTERAGHYGAWMDEMERLVGRDSPIWLNRHLLVEPVPADDLRRAMAVAAAYPNDFWLLSRVACPCRNQRLDSAMSLSIYFAAGQNRHMLGDGGHGRNPVGITYALGDLGCHAEIIAALISQYQADLGRGDYRWAAWDCWYMADALVQAGWYEKAIGAYQWAYRYAKSDDLSRRIILLNEGVAAALAGREDLLAQILRDHPEELQKDDMAPLLETYLQLLRGRKMTLDEAPKYADSIDRRIQLQWQILYAQIDLMAGQDRYRDEVRRAVIEWSGWRPFWILYDLYDRRDPRPESAAFYKMMACFHGDDPWVCQAVADFHARVAHPTVLSVEEVEERLKDYTTERWPQRPKVGDLSYRVAFGMPPGTMTSVLLSLLVDGQYDRAEALALRYHHLAVKWGAYQVRVHANRLVHMVEQARPPAPKAGGAPQWL